MKGMFLTQERGKRAGRRGPLRKTPSQSLSERLPPTELAVQTDKRRRALPLYYFEPGMLAVAIGYVGLNCQRKSLLGSKHEKLRK